MNLRRFLKHQSKIFTLLISLLHYLTLYYSTYFFFRVQIQMILTKIALFLV
jgi:hypothetical protein